MYVLHIITILYTLHVLHSMLYNAVHSAHMSLLCVQVLGSLPALLKVFAHDASKLCDDGESTSACLGEEWQTNLDLS